MQVFLETELCILPNSIGQASHMAALWGRKLCVTNSGRALKCYVTNSMDTSVGEEWDH